MVTSAELPCLKLHLVSSFSQKQVPSAFILNMKLLITLKKSSKVLIK